MKLFKSKAFTHLSLLVLTLAMPGCLSNSSDDISEPSVDLSTKNEEWFKNKENEFLKFFVNSQDRAVFSKYFGQPESERIEYDYDKYEYNETEFDLPFELESGYYTKDSYKWGEIELLVVWQVGRLFDDKDEKITFCGAKFRMNKEQKVETFSHGRLAPIPNFNQLEKKYHLLSALKKRLINESAIIEKSMTYKDGDLVKQWSEYEFNKSHVEKEVWTYRGKTVAEGWYKGLSRWNGIFLEKVEYADTFVARELRYREGVLIHSIIPEWETIPEAEQRWADNYIRGSIDNPEIDNKGSGITAGIRSLTQLGEFYDWAKENGVTEGYRVFQSSCAWPSSFKQVILESSKLEPSIEVYYVDFHEYQQTRIPSYRKATGKLSPERVEIIREAVRKTELWGTQTENYPSILDGTYFTYEGVSGKDYVHRVYFNPTVITTHSLRMDIGGAGGDVVVLGEIKRNCDEDVIYEDDLDIDGELEDLDLEDEEDKSGSDDAVVASEYRTVKESQKLFLEQCRKHFEEVEKIKYPTQSKNSMEISDDETTLLLNDLENISACTKTALRILQYSGEEKLAQDFIEKASSKKLARVIKKAQTFGHDHLNQREGYGDFSKICWSKDQSYICDSQGKGIFVAMSTRDDDGHVFSINIISAFNGYNRFVVF